MSKYLRAASVVALSVFALAVWVQSAESRAGFGGGGGFHGGGFRGGGGGFHGGGGGGFRGGFAGAGGGAFRGGLSGGGGAFRSGFVGARGFQSGFSGRGMRVGNVAGFSRGGFNRAAGFSRGGFNRVAGFSRSGFSRSAMSGSRSFTSRGFATRSFTGSAGNRAIQGRQLASNALANRTNATGGLNRNGNLMNGPVRGVGRAAFLRNNAFAAASGRTALASASFRGGFAGRNWWREGNWWHGNRGWWWRHHHPIIAIGWFGGLFWPFAYWDFVDYTFWPYAYDVFWPYAYDDLYVGVFGPYAYEGPAYTNRVRSTRYARRNGHQSPTVPVVCSAKATALTDWPIQQITELVQPDQAQQAALNELKDATAKAVDTLQSACPDDLPSTPTGRLAAMDKRIGTMLLALSIVEPPMKRFYDSLSDEQKARFNTVNTGAQASSSRGGRLADLSQQCGEEMMKTTIMPSERIVRAVNPTEPQRNALNELNEAANKAAEFLKANCSTAEPMTPTSRVVAMEQRLQTMSKAIRIVEPALQNFYGLLTDEQKARFNQLGSTGS
jgi:hypothetical protein